mmetsp:Transcript_48104/g.85364  ORF Transcript_48104/g.85364 Transcript_48104/m.85364 type:complete len:412 (+) Transcript_48104:128-1363(+)
MKLLPLGAKEQSDWEDGLWVEKPGYPVIDCSWIHPPPEGHSVPEFEFEEGDDKNKNEPAPVFYVGSGEDCHVRIASKAMPEKVCRVYKEGRVWLLEALLPGGEVHFQDKPLEVGVRTALKDGDTFTLAQPPTAFAYQILLNDEDNWYIDLASEKEYPNKYPGRFPHRTSLADAPQAPEELKRLAWQTDQMRRRSEEDQVRVADWSAFSQYVKRHYYKYGIECVPWADVGRSLPIEKKPPSFPPRAYPDWIAQLLQREKQLPGMERQLPFASCMEASGRQAPGQMEFKHEPPRAQDLNHEASGHASAFVNATGNSQGAPVEKEHAVASAAAEPPKVNPHLRLSFREWLENMDDSMFLMQYHDQIVANFDSLEQVHEIYFKDGELRGTFFEDIGIKKLGHRRIFQKWFRDHCR